MKKRRLPAAALVGTLAWALTGATAQAADAADMTPQAKADIRHLLEITGASNMGSQMTADTADQLVRILRSATPKVPDKAFEVVKNEMNAIVSEQVYAPGGLIDQVIPVYGKYFTPAEVRDLIKFYESPLGRKTVATMPQVMVETLAIGQKWSQALAPEIDRRVTDALAKQGLLPKAPPPATQSSPAPLPPKSGAPAEQGPPQ